MQQRRLRLGDVLDDYCPRERRITNHAVVAMVGEEVKQTRCTTCDAEHEYKQAKVPASRRRKRDDAPDALPPAPLLSPGAHVPEFEADEPIAAAAAGPDPDAPIADGADGADAPEHEPEDAPPFDDEGPVHRPLIRATLPRPEGQAPERKAPDFTVRQPGSRFDPQRNGQRTRGRHGRRQAKGGQPDSPSPSRFGTRSGAPQPSRHGNRPGAQPPRGGRPPGPNRGPRPGGGQGRKRGR